MNKIILSLALLAGVGFLVWQFSPGFRAKVSDVYDSYGGWTEEARKKDPVGYVEYAIQKLGEDRLKFEAARVTLGETEKSATAKLTENEALHLAAVELSEAFRDEYKTAEDGGGYPVSVAGNEYTQAQLVSQVQLVLVERDTYAKAIDAFQGALGTLTESKNEVSARIIQAKQQITVLEVQRDVLKIEQLTAETEDLLAKVNDLLGENEKVLSDDPVRTVEELLNAVERQEADAEAETKPAADSAALEFLSA